MFYQKDTIAAISTALGEGAIGIVRMSGPEALHIANQVFKGANLEEATTHTMHYGHLISPKTERVVDEVMVNILLGPRSFTTEDVVEINCHGGVIAVQRVLELLLENGARLSQPGEFSQRAFLNGRVDLSQAEAIMDIIQAKTERAMDASMNQLQGSLKEKITRLRQKMLETLAQVEVSIDYPEYDGIEELSFDQLLETSQEIRHEALNLLKKARQGRMFREGIRTAIIGRPNVGKSSLLNALIGEEKAIVTEIAGTTRDTIEEYITINGVPLHLIDTAGIRRTDDLVEQIGVKRSEEAIQEADLLVLVLNQSETLQEEDLRLLEQTKDHTRLILLNKQDLPTAIDSEVLFQHANADEVIRLSVLEELGIEDFQEKINELFFAGKIEQDDMNYLLNTRHTQLLQEVIDSLDEVIQGAEIGVPIDLIQIDYTHAWNLLGEITGESVQDELITTLFSEFCLGK